MGDPSNLARSLTVIQQQLQATTAGAVGNLLNGAMLIQQVVFATGATTIVRHNLGRTPNGYLVVRNRGIVGVVLRDGVLTAGLSLNQALALIASAGSTLDILIF